MSMLAPVSSYFREREKLYGREIVGCVGLPRKLKLINELILQMAVKTEF